MFDANKVVSVFIGCSLAQNNYFNAINFKVFKFYEKQV